MKSLRSLLVVWLLAPLSALNAVEHLIHPGESPQMALDGAAAGDRLVLLPGVHEHGLGMYWFSVSRGNRCSE